MINRFLILTTFLVLLVGCNPSASDSNSKSSSNSPGESSSGDIYINAGVEPEAPETAEE